MTHKYVLIGTPNADTNTHINRLLELGLYTIKDVAKFVKDSRIAQHRPTPQEDRLGFQKEVYTTQISWENEIPHHVPVAFIDKGLHDRLLDYNLDENRAPPQLWNAAMNANYSGVFFLQSRNTYTNTKLRPETAQHAHELGERTKEIYTKCGLTPIEIPPLSLDEQVLVVLDRVELGFKGTGQHEDYISLIREKNFQGKVSQTLPVYSRICTFSKPTCGDLT